MVKNTPKDSEIAGIGDIKNAKYEHAQKEYSDAPYAAVEDNKDINFIIEGVLVMTGKFKTQNNPTGEYIIMNARPQVAIVGKTKDKKEIQVAANGKVNLKSGGNAVRNIMKENASRLPFKARFVDRENENGQTYTDMTNWE